MRQKIASPRRGSIVLAVLLAVLPVLAASDAPVAIIAKTEPSAVAPAKLRELGLGTALAGRFDEGLKHLQNALKLDPSDKLAGEAARLLEQYLRSAGQVAQERQEELRQAVERVGHSMTAQRFLDSTSDPNQLDAFRAQVGKVIDAYNGATGLDDLEEAADEKVAEAARSRSVKALGEAIDALPEALRKLPAEKGEYTDLVRSIAAQAEKLLSGYRAAWKAVDVRQAAARRTEARRLKDMEYDLTDALADLEAMTLKKPWRVALVQARLARRLAADKDALAGEEWFRHLVAAVRARAEKFVRQAEWYDAFSAYAGLKELLPDDEKLQDMVQVVGRHVRVLNLYGREVPGGKSARAAVPDWRDLVKNVDADMVEKVIEQLDLAYVSSVDYRKVTRGALTSVKVLAETPQAARSFEGLKDEAKRAAFLKAVDRQLGDVRKRDRVDHLNLIIALNSVLRASEQTVNIPTQVLAVEFTDGLLDELDRFSSMVWPHDVPDWKKQTMGEFFGVGIQITKEEGEPLRVVTPLLGTPAFRAGVKAGDLVLKVDGEDTKSLRIEQLVRKIMGEKDTKVSLTIQRGREVMEVDIVRAEIQIPTVKGWQRQPKSGQWSYLIDPGEGIGYIRVTQFTEETTGRIVSALRELRDRRVRAVVLDLRFNPGGLLRVATGVADEFLIPGLICSTKGRRTRRTDFRAGSQGTFLDGDLVVLVNQYSASAAEIVSGALKDWKRARIVGQRTYGKGSVQHVISIRRHAAILKLTTAYYYLPQGRLLHRKNGAKTWGVDPDVEVFITPRQTKRWLDIRYKTDIVDDVDPNELRADLARQYEADLQLNTAVLLLKLMRLQERSAAA